MSRERNNVKAGLFVAAGLVLIGVVVVALSDLRGWFTPMQDVQVRFTLADGLQGLGEGAVVTIGDVPAGSVRAITDERDDQGAVVAKRVVFRIPDAYRVYRDAVVELVVPPLGTGTRLNIRSFGHAEPYAFDTDPPLDGGIAGSTLTRDFASDLGIQDLQRQQVQDIIANVDRIMAELGEDPAPIGEIVVNVRDLTAQLRDDLPRITANVEAATDDLRLLTADLRVRSGDWFDRLDSLTENADAAVMTAREMLEENRPVLAEALEKGRDTLDHTEEITRRVRDETLDQLADMLAKADEAVENVRESTEQLQAFVTGQRPVLERTIANARIVSDQLKLTAIEVRRSPWRLLYEPGDRELETDNLYDAARSFALAAGTLDATTESLRAILDRHEERIGPDHPEVKLILENLHQTFERYHEAESKFWDALGGRVGR